MSLLSKPTDSFKQDPGRDSMHACRCYFVMVQPAQAMTGSCYLQLSTLSCTTGLAIVVIMMQSTMPIAVPNVIKIVR